MKLSWPLPSGVAQLVLLMTRVNHVVSGPIDGRGVLEGLGDGPVLNVDFADPALFRGNETEGWYAFATSGNGKQVQMARAPNWRDTPYGPWQLLDKDALPYPPLWATGQNTWAPDVHKISLGAGYMYVMYFAGVTKADPSKHCIGVAMSLEIEGPYIAANEPFACPLDQGGAIDPSGFVDTDGRRYVLYKVDGNSLGHGGSCGNTVAPIVPTPIMLQEVDRQGVNRIGAPVAILDRVAADGPLVEAPSLVRLACGTYLLLFSSGCFTAPSYNVNYALADRIAGPYERAVTPIVSTGQRGLASPGGATAAIGRREIPYVAYHADCPAGRCMHISQLIPEQGGNVGILF
ncbi:endo-arabinase [Xylariomycetidae sp. FL2044]|nr:endo-arabinase [Xylariomycetidae sp. FL2044]